MTAPAICRFGVDWPKGGIILFLLWSLDSRNESQSARNWSGTICSNFNLRLECIHEQNELVDVHRMDQHFFVVLSPNELSLNV